MRHLRALFVLFHLIAITLMSIPAPVGGMNRALWHTAEGREEITAWSGAVRSLGFDVTDQAFEDFVWNVGSAWLSFRNALVEPVKPWLQYTGARQSWRMFSMVSHKQARIAVLLDRGQGFEPSFIPIEHETWRRTELRQERTRAVLSEFYGLESKKGYGTFVDRLAEWARADFPDARALRVEIRVRETPLPGRALDEERVLWRQQRKLR